MLADTFLLGASAGNSGRNSQPPLPRTFCESYLFEVPLPLPISYRGIEGSLLGPKKM
jgi:hypothetical protein